MSKLNGQAKEVLDACLSAESPEVRAKVYQIIDVSGLDPSDPMFLILALTGQMRVLLEAAPADLSKLLTDWTEQASSSLQSIQRAIEQVTATRQQEAETMKLTLKSVASECVENILAAGMAATSAIASANQEVLGKSIETVNSAQQLKDEIIGLRTMLSSERIEHVKVLNAVQGQIGQTTSELRISISNIKQSYTALHQLQSNLEWLQIGKWLSPMLALVGVGVSGIMLGVWVRQTLYNTPLTVY